MEIPNPSEAIPARPGSDEAGAAQSAGDDTMVILPVRDTVLFPGVLFPISIGRPISIAAVQQAGAAWALARRGDAEHAQKHVQAARERRSRVDQRALPALLVATVAEKDRGKVALQLTLLRRALLGRY